MAEPESGKRRQWEPWNEMIRFEQNVSSSPLQGSVLFVAAPADEGRMLALLTQLGPNRHKVRFEYPRRRLFRLVARFYERLASTTARESLDLLGDALREAQRESGELLYCAAAAVRIDSELRRIEVAEAGSTTVWRTRAEGTRAVWPTTGSDRTRSPFPLGTAHPEIRDRQLELEAGEGVALMTAGAFEVLHSRLRLEADGSISGPPRKDLRAPVLDAAGEEAVAMALFSPPQVT